MKIVYEEQELEQAIARDLESQGLSLTNKSISIDFVAGRSGNGHRAEIEITNLPGNVPTEVETSMVVEPGPEIAVEEEMPAPGSVFSRP